MMTAFGIRHYLVETLVVNNDNNETQVQQPNGSPEHERRSRGYAGLGQTSKVRFVTGENASLDNAFYNDSDSRLVYKREKPIHRQFIEHAIQGYNNREIARLFSTTVVTVSNILRQPWAREYMQSRMKENTQDELAALLKSETLPSLKKLVSIRDADSTPAAVVASVSNSILDRVLGKAAQPILNTNVDLDKLDDNELRRIAATGSTEGITATRN